jgi:hypothetical protein
MERKKIVIFEDDSGDFNRRYGAATRGHDVTAYATGYFEMEEIEHREDIKSMLEEGIINKDEFDEMSEDSKKIYLGIPQEIPDADFYFTDGLNGDCFSILEKLPKDRSYLVSGDSGLREEAISLGYQTAHEFDIESIVNADNS